MERLISLFKRPEDFEFAQAADENYPYPWLDQSSAQQPEYFVQLMQYLRERNEKSGREAAD